MPNARDDLKSTSRRPYALPVVIICALFGLGFSSVIFCHSRIGSRYSGATVTLYELRINKNC